LDIVKHLGPSRKTLRPT